MSISVGLSSRSWWFQVWVSVAGTFAGGQRVATHRGRAFLGVRDTGEDAEGDVRNESSCRERYAGNKESTGRLERINDVVWCQPDGPALANASRVTYRKRRR